MTTDSNNKVTLDGIFRRSLLKLRNRTTSNNSDIADAFVGFIEYIKNNSIARDDIIEFFNQPNNEDYVYIRQYVMDELDNLNRSSILVSEPERVPPPIETISVEEVTNCKSTSNEEILINELDKLYNQIKILTQDIQINDDKIKQLSEALQHNQNALSQITSNASELHKINTYLKDREINLVFEIKSLTEEIKHAQDIIEQMKINITKNSSEQIHEKITTLLKNNEKLAMNICHAERKINKLKKINHNNKNLIHELTIPLKNSLEIIFPKKIYSDIFSKNISSLTHKDIEQIYRYLLIILHKPIEDAKFTSRFEKFDKLISKENRDLCQKIIDDLNSRLTRYRIYLPKIGDNLILKRHNALTRGNKISKVLSFGISDKNSNYSIQKSQVECEDENIPKTFYITGINMSHPK